MEPKYRIEEELTAGLNLVGSKLTKEECQKKYNELLDIGISPDRIKITRES